MRSRFWVRCHSKVPVCLACHKVRQYMSSNAAEHKCSGAAHKNTQAWQSAQQAQDALSPDSQSKSSSSEATWRQDRERVVQQHQQCMYCTPAMCCSMQWCIRRRYRPAHADAAPPAGVASLVTIFAKAPLSTGGFSPGNALNCRISAAFTQVCFIVYC